MHFIYTLVYDHAAAAAAALCIDKIYYKNGGSISYNVNPLVLILALVSDPGES